MTLADIALIGVGCLGAFLIIVEAVARTAEMRFFSTVVLGADGRTSTSKTFVLLWTLLVAWALVTLLIAGELVSTHHCVASGTCAARHDSVGLLQLGWTHLLAVGVTGSYLVLLGIPGVAAVTAKGITQSQIQSSMGFKSTRPAVATRSWTSAFSVQGLRALAARIAEIFADDQSSTDIGDFQYLIFNLVTAVYFVAQFLSPDGSGLPAIPDTLLALTGVSASLYVGKKAVSRTQPTVAAVFPLPLREGQEFTVLGEALTEDPSAPTPARPQIAIDDLVVTGVKIKDGNLTGIAPPRLISTGSSAVRQLHVLNPYGAVSADFQVTCVAPGPKPRTRVPRAASPPANDHVAAAATGIVR